MSIFSGSISHPPRERPIEKVVEGRGVNLPEPANVCKGMEQCVDGHVAPVERNVSGIDAKGDRVWVGEREHIAPSELTSGMHVHSALYLNTIWCRRWQTWQTAT
jgi:hypothetical protein